MNRVRVAMACALGAASCVALSSRVSAQVSRCAVVVEEAPAELVSIRDRVAEVLATSCEIIPAGEIEGARAFVASGPDIDDGAAAQLAAALRVERLVLILVRDLGEGAIVVRLRDRTSAGERRSYLSGSPDAIAASAAETIRHAEPPPNASPPAVPSAAVAAPPPAPAAVPTVAPLSTAAPLADPAAGTAATAGSGGPDATAEAPPEDPIDSQRVWLALVGSTPGFGFGPQLRLDLALVRVDGAVPSAPTLGVELAATFEYDGRLLTLAPPLVVVVGWRVRLGPLDVTPRVGTQLHLSYTMLPQTRDWTLDFTWRGLAGVAAAIRFDGGFQLLVSADAVFGAGEAFVGAVGVRL